jgi:hypothetical protein
MGSHGWRARALAFRRTEREHAQHAHLEAGARARRQRQVAATVERHLVPELHDFRTQRGGKRVDVNALPFHRGIRHELAYLHAMQRIGQSIEHAAPVGRKLRQHADFREQCRAIATRQRSEQRADAGSVHGPEHGRHGRIVQRAAGIGDRLVQ